VFQEVNDDDEIVNDDDETVDVLTDKYVTAASSSFVMTLEPGYNLCNLL